jgi:hypothetical protein
MIATSIANHLQTVQQGRILDTLPVLFFAVARHTCICSFRMHSASALRQSRAAAFPALHFGQVRAARLSRALCSVAPQQDPVCALAEATCGGPDAPIAVLADEALKVIYHASLT